MLARSLDDHRASFDVLANAWLASGATAFAVWVGDERIAVHPAGAGNFHATLVAPVTAQGNVVGELRVAGPRSATAQERLAADARMIGLLAGLEQDMDDMTSRLIDSQDQLLAFYDLTEATRHYLTLELKLARLALEATRLAKVEGAFLVIRLPDGRVVIHQHPTSTFKRSSLRTYLREMRASERAIVLNENEKPYPRPGNVNNLLLMPIRIRNQITAGLGLFNKHDARFTSPDLKLARAIAEHAGAQIENALLHQENLDQAKLQTEMKMAQSVQLNLLPEMPAAVEGLDLWAASRPASETGGDFYDFIARADRPFTFVVGDVSGKGMPAALLMAMTRTVVRTKANDAVGLTPEAVMAEANQELYDSFTDVSMFATVFVGQYEKETRQLLYANAGHSPVIYCPAGGEAHLMQADGTPMGVLPTSLSQDQRMQFRPGDVLVVGTDGLNDARNGRDEMYGYDRLLRRIESLRSRPARVIADGLYRSVSRFSTGHPQDDDQTLVVLKANE